MADTYSMAPLSLWILTEERPKSSIVRDLLAIFSKHRLGPAISGWELLQIEPVLTAPNRFDFQYRATGIACGGEPVSIQICAGSGSFVDYMLFVGERAPEPSDLPVMLVEVTKTSDAESRNTGAFQRGTKFAYARHHYPTVPLFMYFDHADADKPESASHDFGSRLLATLGVETYVRGRRDTVDPFESVQDMVAARALVSPPKSGAPVTLSLQGGQLLISCRLEKRGGIGHDPNIGFATSVSSAARRLGWVGSITITNHGLSGSRHLSGQNKFARLATTLDVSLEGIGQPHVPLSPKYWYLERRQEKHASILAAILAENTGRIQIAFEHHGGSEQGYLVGLDGAPQPVGKDISKPDLVLVDAEREILGIYEAKTERHLEQGRSQLQALNTFADTAGGLYPGFTVTCGLIILGEGPPVDPMSPDIGFWLDSTTGIYQSGRCWIA